ncbi:unnamed protein product [Mytilus coruscus]|uniref:Transcriptional coactivator p15 (PC4) C-terminal domain-containing protein n=1 Tax=Mytilus coruscus TaxID=42192 RepID=A0A6J8AKW8_MYTCO|nr:unnamed protein product [Mytilus coruscus]
MLKWTGVVVILILSASTLWITCGVYESSKHNTNMTDYIKIDQNFDFNQSLCSFIRHFGLPGEFVLTTCEYNSRTIIDVRQFLNHKPTIKGISLTLIQWNYLTSITQLYNNNPRNPGRCFLGYDEFFELVNIKEALEQLFKEFEEQKQPMQHPPQHHSPQTAKGLLPLTSQAMSPPPPYTAQHLRVLN